MDDYEIFWQNFVGALREDVKNFGGSSDDPLWNIWEVEDCFSVSRQIVDGLTREVHIECKREGMDIIKVERKVTLSGLSHSEEHSNIRYRIVFNPVGEREYNRPPSKLPFLRDDHGKDHGISEAVKTILFPVLKTGHF